MKRFTKLTLAAVATLGLAAVAAPIVAQQTQMQHGGKMGSPMGMMGSHDGMMSGAMGMMMGAAQSHAMAMFDTDKDGTLSPEEMTVGIQAEIKTYDADGNGTLSLEEFAVMHAAHTRPLTVRAFQMHDPDGDAQVTEAEMAAMAAMMESHSGWQHGDMQGRHRGMMGDN